MRRLVLVFILLLAIAGLLGWAISQSAGCAMTASLRIEFLGLPRADWLSVVAGAGGALGAWAAARPAR